MKKNITKKTSISLKEILSNNFYMLKIICTKAPALFWGQIILAVFSSLFGFLTYSYMLRYALNGLTNGKSFREILHFIIVCLIAHVFYSIISTICYNYIFPIMRNKFSYKIRKVIYEKAISVELECYDNPKYYDNFSKAIGECQSQANNLMNSIVNFISIAVNFSANVILVFLIDPILIVFALIPIVCVFFTSKSNKLDYQKSMRIMEERRRQEYSQRTFYLSEYAKEMRLTNMPILMLKRFNESGEKILKTIKKYGLSFATLSYLKTECIEVISILGATLYATLKTFVFHAMGYGDCIVVINSIGAIVETLMDSTDLFIGFQRIALYIREVRKFLDYVPKLVGGEQKIEKNGDLEINDLSFRYDQNSPYVLKNITMKFGAKEKIAIVGANGAGKTTLIKLLLRLYDTTEGNIRYCEKDIKEYQLEEYRNAFSVVMQDHHVFSLSVAENILKREKNEDDNKLVEEALIKVDLLEKINRFNKGMDTILTKEFDESGEILSGGEQQKIAIAHIYTKSPCFVILDEPSSALDPISEYSMYEQMKKACSNCGMIFISHRLSLTVNADHIYFLEKGQVIEHGQHRELMKKNGRYAEMFRHQSENYRR